MPASKALELPIQRTREIGIRKVPGAGALPAVAKEGDSDWALKVKVGSLPIAIILVGKVEG